MFSALLLFFVPSPTVGGCPVFPADNVWNTPVDQLPVSAYSQRFIKAAGATRTLHADLGTDLKGGGIPFAVVPADQVPVSVTFEYADDSDRGPYPIPPNPPIEGGGGDRHILLVQSGACKLFELFAASLQPNGKWKAGSGAIFDLRSNALRPNDMTSADAAGLPILPGLIRYDEVAAGAINHALRLTVPKTRRAHIWPARHDASSLTDPVYPPMGQRFRLKADFDISSYPEDAQVVLTALKRYGMILADNGSSWYLTGAPDPRWNMNTITKIKGVTGADLEAVDTSSLKVNSHSGQARTSLTIAKR
jgi:hypothetical protein